MKKCLYCGKEFPDDALNCDIDGQPFTTEVSGKLADVWNWTPQSSLGLAFTSGLASLLICNSIFYSGGQVISYISKIWRMNHAGDTVMPVMYDLSASSPTGIPWHSITWHSYVALFSLGTLIFTCFVCNNRCKKRSHGIIATIITFGIIGLLTIMPMFVPRLISFLWLVPLVDMTFIFGSVGWYTGAVLQIFAGAWLLGWFRQRKPPNKPPEPTATAS